MNDTTPSATQSEAASPDVAPAFVCDCSKRARSACQGEPFFREHKGKRYCVLHYPGADKLEAFRVAFNRKLEGKDYKFLGVWFPEEVNFRGFEFSADADFYGARFSANAYFTNAKFGANADFTYAEFGANAYFFSATFSAVASFLGATFSAKADFFGARFSANASFYDSTFSADASFSGATFSADASFSGATFSADPSFSGATFSANADFSDATFSVNADFTGATFKSYANFAGSDEQRSFGEQNQLDFQFAHIEKPERVSFHTLDLKPHWFINCDCRKFEFVDCEWNHNLKQELESATNAEISAPHRLLAITFRQLADNAEANHRYHEASNFRYNAFEARRVETYGGFAFWRLDWWYWFASGYGERVLQAFLVFLGIFILFAVLFTQVGFDQSAKNMTTSATQAATAQPDTIGKPLDWQDAFIYSFYVTILQKPKPEPLTRTAKILVGLETVLGPAQAALLALAVRRRFMR
ncbi:MAG: pentapeptide repeat-containing protein [Acidobacteria bacterium]|nr:pentapeptide repeat-containing protein [Acidobacteriota bacterium]